MAVECIKKYRQKNGEDVLKVILKPTQKFPDGYFYCDAIDETLARQYTWFLQSRKKPYIIATSLDYGGTQTKLFHQEKANNILNYYPDYINHINGIGFDNINQNLDIVSQQQNQWCKPSRGYSIAGRSFLPYVRVNSCLIHVKCVPTEVEACQSAYQLELQYENYMYSFLKDRRKDVDLLDLERTGKISEEEAVYRHVLRHATDNAWYYYRYNLADYFNAYNISVPKFSADIDGFMCHSVTGQKLCPL